LSAEARLPTAPIDESTGFVAKLPNQ